MLYSFRPGLGDVFAASPAAAQLPRPGERRFRIGPIRQLWKLFASAPAITPGLSCRMKEVMRFSSASVATALGGSRGPPLARHCPDRPPDN
jgi:hypothetical protein